ncbi:MAG: serine/threonine-protein kinase [Candidatus Eremiobacteraeota bacterium]|nr:serine/threonine-protein kinase [Candidatus Eremiobacteraeota bacterium]
MLSAGDIIQGRYKMVKPLGEGSSGVVYLVEDTGAGGSLLALKELDLTGSSPDEKREYSELFGREISMLKSMRHRGMPRFIDSFLQGDSQFLVMEYIEGETLDEIVEKNGRPFTPEELIPMAWQLSSIIEYLHTRKPYPVIYRDLKPSNIMRTARGTLKLIDFGIARHYNPKKLRDTHFMGTPGFSPPEQYGIGQSDMRTDMFSFGATLYYLLTGEDLTAFNFKFPPLKERVSGVPPELERIIMRCLSPNPGERYQTTSLLKLDTMILYYRRSGPLASFREMLKRWPQYRRWPGWSYLAFYGSILAFMNLLSSEPVHSIENCAALLIVLALLAFLAMLSCTAHLKKREKKLALCDGVALYLTIVALLPVLANGQWLLAERMYSKGAYGGPANETPAVYSKDVPVNGKRPVTPIYNYNWGEKGIQVTKLEGSQEASFSFAPEGYTSLVVAFVNTWDERSWLYLQKIVVGKRVWTDNGKLLCPLEQKKAWPRILSDSDNGWYVIWCDIRKGSTADNSPLSIFIQRINSEGRLLWEGSGIEASEIAGCTDPPSIVSDMEGGVIISWADTQVLRAQRIDREGRRPWGPSGITIAEASGQGKWVNRPQLVSDDKGGAVIAWEDARNNPHLMEMEATITNFDIYAQRISAKGEILWDRKGVPVCIAQYAQRNCALVKDEKGGAIAAWEDYRDETSSRIYVQALSSDGVQRWEGDGIVATRRNPKEPYGDDGFGPDVWLKHFDVSAISDGDSGIVVAWAAGGHFSWKIGLQRFDGSGTKQWGEIGISLQSCIARPPRLLGREWIGDYMISWLENDEGDDKHTYVMLRQIEQNSSRARGTIDFRLSPSENRQYGQQLQSWHNELYLLWMESSGAESKIFAQYLYYPEGTFARAIRPGAACGDKAVSNCSR